MASRVNLKSNKTKRKMVERMAVRSADKKVLESIVDGIAKAIKEKPEDVIWFFQVREVVRSMDKPMSDDKAWEVIMEDKKSVKLSTAELIEVARVELKKFRRIERKLKKLGVI
ncbi:hypothetical protein A3L11_06350 [Thermococcus siculi]|uniref:Uncharacterized protein n=1 Tax=Thermococcus siculi TaxID=72803 RepID=A0A2Z2MML8_9EURY|nr:hypothetical protein [Thermococcus siculi]ASJ08865.1 hypothetical protein A3L11_06350 [Thermococcus siculi]